MLIKKGVRRVFDKNQGTSSHFMKLCSDKKIYISDFKQKIFLEVGEEGVKGSAATATNMTETRGPIDCRKTVMFNRLFIHVLRYGDF